jgi:hypothetical protein
MLRRHVMELMDRTGDLRGPMLAFSQLGDGPTPRGSA